MCDEATIILAVVHDDGRTAHPRGSTATLFEVAEGPHEGIRGADWQLFDRVGPICWDQARVVSYETGQRRPAERGEEQGNRIKTRMGNIGQTPGFSGRF